MFELLGLCLFLAALLTLNTLLASGVTLLWRRLAARSWRPATKARLIFTLRVAPVLLSLGLALAVVLPAYLLHEPRHNVEPVSFKLAILTALALLGVLLALWRGVRAWWVTRRLVQNWLQHATRIELAALPLPAYRLAHPYPVVALVGCWRPRLFLAEQLCQTLTPDELAATIAHEAGHWHARDNGKRVLLRVCCDVLALLPTGRALDRAWAEAAEAAADEYAASTGRGVALNLASALVKIARRIPAGVSVAVPVGAAIVGSDAAGIAPRVQALLNLDSRATVHAARQGDSGLSWLTLLGVVAGLALLAASPRFLASVHQLTEFILACLQ
jgi:Zn-dependent protease with chaperone function